MTSGSRDLEPTWRNNPQVVERPPWTSGRKVTSWVWAFAPLLTIGLATAPVFLYAAVRQRTAGWWAAFGAYAVTTGVIFYSTSQPDGSGWDDATGGIAAVMWLIGSGHAIATRHRVFEPAPTFDQVGEPAIAYALHAQERRVLARQILAEDPRLASDLGIGRPDLSRGYDDGGLVDANSAPPHVLATLPDLGTAAVERIVAARTAASGFSSLEELAVLANVPPGVLDRLRDRVVLSPRL